jgi:stage V sporulation protein R
MKPFYTGSEWTIPLIEKAYDIVQKVNDKYFHLDVFPCQLEIVSADQAADILSLHGLPESYPHWSFGKRAVQIQEESRNGVFNSFAELIINSNPCRTYLMEENTMTWQLLVICHACIGHSAMFKNNYLFKELTHPNSIIDYCKYAKSFIHNCEEKYGRDRVEKLIDRAHFLRYAGFTRCKKENKIENMEEEIQRLKIKADEENFNVLWSKVDSKIAVDTTRKQIKDLSRALPEENLLYFIENQSLILDSWEREVIRIVRTINQEIYPMINTKLLHEGFANFWEYEFMTKLQELGYITEGAFLEFLQAHSGSISQPGFDNKYYDGFNVYSIGYKIFESLKKKHPDNWIEEIQEAAYYHSDSTFVHQYLTNDLIRELRLFSIEDDPEKNHYTVDNIADVQHYNKIRKLLSKEREEHHYIPIYTLDKLDSGFATDISYSGTCSVTKLTNIPMNILGLHIEEEAEDLTDEHRNSSLVLEVLTELLGIPVVGYNNKLNTCVSKW